MSDASPAAALNGSNRQRDITVDELFAISEALNVGPLKLLPNRARLDSPGQDMAINAALQDLTRDRARLEDLTTHMATIEEARKTVEDRVAKNEWLIEQLQQSKSGS